MLESNINVVKNDIKTLVTDAQALFNAATELTGEKADDVRKRGMHLLDAALLKAQSVQACAAVSGREITASAYGYVKENPWRTIGLATGFGLLVGVVLGRK